MHGALLCVDRCDLRRLLAPWPCLEVSLLPKQVLIESASMGCGLMGWLSSLIIIGFLERFLVLTTVNFNVGII
jgi:hypothetical protein